MPVRLTALILCFLLVFSVGAHAAEPERRPVNIKWVDFTIPASAMSRAMDYDIKTYGEEMHLDWIAILAILGTRYGGDWSRYKAREMDKVVSRLKEGETPEEILKGYQNYDYYYTAYHTVLGNFLGVHQREVPNKEKPDQVVLREQYGLKAYSPIAAGYSFSHFRDFGTARNYGYRRPHFGNDLCGSVGTPIIAVEGGIIEELGWNQYGGWRVGIRSFDRLRYYYYAHLRKDHPWPEHLEKGMPVQAGDVIGYMGMTGYSTKENVNGMKIPHLHFGMQLVFDESKKDAPTQLWIDVYDIVELLNRNRATVVRSEQSKDYTRKYRLYDVHFPYGD